MGGVVEEQKQQNNLLDELQRKEQFIQGRLAKAEARLERAQAGGKDKLERKVENLLAKLEAIEDEIEGLL